MPPKPACTAILIHGVGNQPKNWSQTFRAALNAALGGDASQVRLLDAYWAPRSEFDAMLPIWGGDRIRRRPR